MFPFHNSSGCLPWPHKSLDLLPLFGPGRLQFFFEVANSMLTDAVVSFPGKYEPTAVVRRLRETGGESASVSSADPTESESDSDLDPHCSLPGPPTLPTLGFQGGTGGRLGVVWPQQRHLQRPRASEPEDASTKSTLSPKSQGLWIFLSGQAPCLQRPWHSWFCSFGPFSDIPVNGAHALPLLPPSGRWPCLSCLLLSLLKLVLCTFPTSCWFLPCRRVWSCLANTSSG